MPTAVTFYILVNAIAVAPGAATDASFVAGYERFFNEDGAQQGSGGELLISELSCTACHTTHDTLLQPKRGPQLDSVGLRVQREWLLQYLASPQTVKPGTTMPNMLHGMPQNEIDRVAHALTAYLMSQRKPLPELVSSAGNPIAFEFWRKGNVDRGKVLYHQVGCVACHAPDSEYETDKNYNSDLESLLAQLEPDEIRELGLEHAAAPVPSVPHGNLPTKYTQRSLTFFLLDPNSTRPSGRMPSLKLKPEEAADIAAYLLRGQAASPSVEVSENSRLAEEGRRLFAELRCVNCHDIGDSEPVVFAKPLSNLDSDASRSCIGTQHAGLPAYSLTANQLKSVQSKLRLASASDTVVQTASENVYLRMLQLNCYACHERDKRGGVGPNRRDYFATVGHVDLGDEGRLPPPLDGIGEKLTASWFKRVFEGTGDIRPHLFVRMPVFEKSSVASLPTSFTEADAESHSAERNFRSFDKSGSMKTLADAGRSLLDLGCVQCHPLRGEYLPGVVGVDLEGITNRVNQKWFHDFLLNPAALKSRTRMPTFFPNRRSNVPSILDGDVERQIAAIWTYLSDINRQPLPQKIQSSKVHNFELVPEERPILLRTFMQGAGTHAIAVGFPEKVHFAFDAESVRLAQAWRGRFVDAHGTWFDRFTPPAKPLGDDVIAFPGGASFALLSSPDSNWLAESNATSDYRFRGYRIDEAGVPTFLYEFDRFRIEDRVTPTADKQLIRRLQIREIATSQDKRRLWFRAHMGNELRPLTRSSYSSESGLTATLSEDVAQGGMILRSSEGVSAWLVPVDAGSATTIEVNYRW